MNDADPITPDEGREGGTSKRFLGVLFESCGVYGRFYKNAEGTAYVGMCPRCGKHYTIRIGAEGTSNRFFKARCR